VFTLGDSRIARINANKKEIPGYVFRIHGRATVHAEHGLVGVLCKLCVGSLFIRALAATISPHCTPLECASLLRGGAINISLLLRNSLRDLCVLCVSAVVECARPIFTAEKQRTQRSRRESLRFIKLSACAKAALLQSEKCCKWLCRETRPYLFDLATYLGA
jgi:hypothetical protein